MNYDFSCVAVPFTNLMTPVKCLSDAQYVVKFEKIGIYLACYYLSDMQLSVCYIICKLLAYYCI